VAGPAARRRRPWTAPAGSTSPTRAPGLSSDPNPARTYKPDHLVGLCQVASLIVIATVGWLGNVVSTRSLANHAAGMPQIPIPPGPPWMPTSPTCAPWVCGDTATLGRDVDVDLGELVEGHHVVVRASNAVPARRCCTTSSSRRCTSTNARTRTVLLLLDGVRQR
jgi:hypothetical protein